MIPELCVLVCFYNCLTSCLTMRIRDRKAKEDVMSVMIDMSMYSMKACTESFSEGTMFSRATIWREKYCKGS